MKGDALPRRRPHSAICELESEASRPLPRPTLPPASRAANGSLSAPAPTLASTTACLYRPPSPASPSLPESPDPKSGADPGPWGSLGERPCAHAATLALPVVIPHERLRCNALLQFSFKHSTAHALFVHHRRANYTPDEANNLLTSSSTPCSPLQSTVYLTSLNRNPLNWLAEQIV